MPRLTRDQILAASDRVFEEVEVPEWGEGQTVLVWTFHAGARDELEAESLEHPGNAKERLKDFRARLVARTVCDESGTPLFTDADIPALTRKSAKAMDRVVDVAQRLNGIGGGDVEAAVKN